jgi:hypothetical protein
MCNSSGEHSQPAEVSLAVDLPPAQIHLNLFNGGRLTPQRVLSIWDTAQVILSEQAWFGDVVIVGAGPAGLAAASILSREGKQVFVISDSRRHSWAGETLPPGSSELVSGIFGNVLDDAHLRFPPSRMFQ